MNGAGGNTYWLWQGQGSPRSLPADPIVITQGTARLTGASRYTSAR